VLDLTDVTFVSSAGIRVVLTAAKLCRAHGGELYLAGLSPQVLQVFRRYYEQRVQRRDRERCPDTTDFQLIQIVCGCCWACGFVGNTLVLSTNPQARVPGG